MLTWMLGQHSSWCVEEGLRAGPTEAYSNSGLSVTRKVINFEAYKIPTQTIILWFQMSLLTVLSFSASLTALAWSLVKA
jgi:hypothetical protein